MKKRLSLVLVAALLLLGFCGCHLYTPPARQPVSYFDFLGDENVIDFAENFYSEPPVSVAARRDSAESGGPVFSSDPATITAVFEALESITVYDNAEPAELNNSFCYYFEFADGSRTREFAFQGDWVLGDDANVYMSDGVSQLVQVLAPPN